MACSRASSFESIVVKCLPPGGSNILFRACSPHMQHVVGDLSMIRNGSPSQRPKIRKGCARLPCVVLDIVHTAEWVLLMASSRRRVRGCLRALHAAVSANRALGSAVLRQPAFSLKARGMVGRGRLLLRCRSLFLRGLGHRRARRSQGEGDRHCREQTSAALLLQLSFLGVALSSAGAWSLLSAAAAAEAF